jgi:AAA+ superfamily predicted ATPase
VTWVEQRKHSVAPSARYLFSALRALDRRLELAVAAADAAYGVTAGAERFRGLYVDHDEMTRLLSQEPVCAPFDGAAAGLAAEADLSGLAWARELFGLDDFDIEFLLIALAPEVDLRYERVYGFLQDDVTRRKPTVELALNLLCSSVGEKLARRARLAAGAPLLRSGVVHLVADPNQLEPPLLARYLKADDQVVSMLLGQDGLDARLARFARVVEARAAPSEPATEEWQPEVAEIARAHEPAQPPRLYFHGRAGTGKAAAAESLARSLGMDLLAVDLDRALAAGADAGELVHLALRDARFRGAVLCLEGMDALAAEPARPARDAVLTTLAAEPVPTVLTGTRPWAPAAVGPLGIVPIAFLIGDAGRRRDRWGSALAAHGLTVGRGDLEALGDRFRLTARQIDDAVASAAAAGRLHGADPPSTADLMAAARAQAAHGLAALASKLRPSATWDDIVLPPDSTAQLRELCRWVAARERVMGDWGFAARRSLGLGITALFTGPPGSGKTMAADVVAGQLGLDLWRIDLAHVVSKYIGETEKNLDRVFTAATDANAVLLFDEADALFGNRSAVHDAHDRYANLEVAYLLQKMEEYEGLAILATNLRENLDDAFARRLAFTIHFPFPDQASRRRIWGRVWPAQTPLAGDIDPELLARELKVSGGSIRNIGLAAAFLAVGDGDRVAMRHVVHAARRECQKLGRQFPEELGSHAR